MSAAEPDRPAPDPTLARALIRWQRAAGPYWLYVCAAPFLGPLLSPSRPARRPSPPRVLVEAVAPAAARGGTMIVIDGPARSTLAATPLLSRLGLVVVPVIQRWTAAPAILPCERLLEALVDNAARVVRPRDPRGVVLLLDGERAGPPRSAGWQPPREVFDNRYFLRGDRFPSPELLRQQGTRAVLWISTDGVAADLRRYVDEVLKAAGFPVEVLRLRPE